MSDAALKARAVEIFNLTVMAEAASRRSQPVPQKTIDRIASDMTISIMEIVRALETIHIVTANSARGFKILRANERWLRPYERVEGDNIPYARLREGGRRSQYRGIDAEQVAAHVSMSQSWKGWTVRRIAASRDICAACIELFEDSLAHVRLVNPDPKVQSTPNRPRSQGGIWRLRGGMRPIPIQRTTAFTAGQRGAAGLLLLVQGANFLIGEYVSRREEARYRSAIQAKDGFLREFQDKNPTVGVLVIAYFEGGLFRHPLEFSYGMTEIQARRTILPSLRSATARSFAAWVPPLQQADVTSLPPPLAPTMLATFYRSQVFQNLEFRVADGFDDEGETDLGYPQRGREARFWILQPPERVNYYFGSDRGTKEIDTFRWPLVSGEVVDCIDLDPTPLSIGSDCAFPAYPADVATDVTFSRVPGIKDRHHALSSYDFSHVRWIAPHRARSIGR